MMRAVRASIVIASNIEKKATGALDSDGSPYMPDMF
jgi:hypothetical protein